MLLRKSLKRPVNQARLLQLMNGLEKKLPLRKLLETKLSQLPKSQKSKNQLLSQ